MRTDIDLDSAAAAGIIGEDQAIALRNFQALRDRISSASSEKFQIFGGYADLVMGIGIAMVLLAVCTYMLSFDQIMESALTLGAIATATAFAAFKLTQCVQIRASPAIGLVLTIGFGLFSLFSIVLFVVPVIENLQLGQHEEWYIWAIFLPIHIGLALYHWRTFRFPPTFALLIAGYAFIILSQLEKTARRGTFDLSGDPSDRMVVAACALLIASTTLIAAIWWDLTDLRRETERSQVAFWLHCVAGALMSRALFSLLTGTMVSDGNLILTGLTLDQFPWVLAMIAGASVLSLTVDRRSLLVGCLLPTVGIFNGVAEGAMAAVAGLLLAGTSLIFFSLTWIRLRTWLVGLLPAKVAAQLPRTSLIQKGQRPTRRHRELRSLREHDR